MEKPKAVVIIGLRERDNEIEMVKALGYRAILFNTVIDMHDALEADVPVEMDLNDEERSVAKVLSLSKRFEIQAIFTLNEYRVLLAAKMVQALGLPHGLSYEAALHCRHKRRTRERLARHGVGSARYAPVHTVQEALAALAHFSLPVIVKPSNDAGSNLVARCDAPKEVESAVSAITSAAVNWVGQRFDPEILIEEYLEGPEFSVEACTAQGHTVVLAITAKRTTPPPFAIEIGHTVPAPLPPADAQAITQLVVAALAAVGVDDTVTHTEVKLTPSGPRVVEINARPGGDKIPTLVRLTTGYDLRELSLHLALGGTLADAPRHPVAAPSAAVRFITATNDGAVMLNDPLPVQNRPGVYELQMGVRTGDRVTLTTSNYNRLGHVITHGTAEQHADEVAAATLQQLSVQILAAMDTAERR